MGKSFNDDIFNGGFNLDSINGLNISKEAIQENKEKNIPKIDISGIDLKKVKEEIKEEKKQQKKDLQEEFNEIMKSQERLEEKKKEYQKQEQQEQASNTYVKKTMIFKQEYLDIIDGLASINDMQIKDVLNQLLEKSINELDEATRIKALKHGKKSKTIKEDKRLF